MDSAIKVIINQNFFVTMIMGGSIQQIFGLIRMLQMFIIIAMLKIVYPALLMYFYQTVVVIASLDIF